MYVASVKYGRMLLITVESEEQMTKLKAAAEYSFQNLAGASANVEYDNVLKSSSIHGFVMGGSSELGVKTLGKLNGKDGIKDAVNKYIEQGGSAGINNPPAPLSYTLRYLSDGAVGNVLLSTAFKVRNCQKATGTFKVEIYKLMCLQWDDEWGDPHEEYYGSIYFKVWRSEGDLAFSKTVWSRSRDHVVSLRAMQEFGGETNANHEQKRLCTLRIDAKEEFTLTDFHKIKDTAFVEVIGILKEQDFWTEDDTLTSSKKIYLRDTAKNPNKAPNKDEHELYFQFFNMKAKVTFDIKPVSES